MLMLALPFWLILIGFLVPPVRAQGQARPLLPGPVQPSRTADGAATTPVTTLTTGMVSIESDSQRADSVTGVITATGNVRIVYPDRRLVVTARQAQYFSSEERLVLTGDVDIIQADGHAIRAERVTYDVLRERLLASPKLGSQVLSTFRVPVRNESSQ